MIRVLRFLVVVISLATLTACGGGDPKFKSYNGPQVTWIVVNKTDRKLYLFHHDKVLKEYPIELGFAPQGPKRFEGDGKTPEGVYYIDRRNPRSDFHLSLGISYPNKGDVAYAQAFGRSPGGDIFIHGESRKQRRRGGKDWTAGCIAVKDKHIEEIYAMVRDSTPIYIKP